MLITEMFIGKNILCQNLCQINFVVPKIAIFGHYYNDVSFVQDQEVVGSNPVISTLIPIKGIFLRRSAFFALKVNIFARSSKKKSKGQILTRDIKSAIYQLRYMALFDRG